MNGYSANKDFLSPLAVWVCFWLGAFAEVPRFISRKNPVPNWYRVFVAIADRIGAAFSGRFDVLLTLATYLILFSN